MLNSKNRSIFFHIGLPKTGTTSIQETFKLNFLTFSKYGVGGLCSNGNGSHTRLASRLATKNISDINYVEQTDESYLLELEKNSDGFPLFDSHRTLFISSEDFYKISLGGALEVINFSKENNAALQILAAIRNPNEWLFSMWAQYTKSHWIDWHDFIELATSNKEGFLSSFLTPWLNPEVSSIQILRFTRSNWVPSFIKLLGAPNELLSELDLSLSSTNNGAGVSNSIYQAAISKLVLEEIYSGNRLHFHQPSKGFVHRMLLDISDVGASTWEMASMYGVKILEERKVLGSDTYGPLNKFVSSWVDDAFKFLKDADQWLDRESKDNILSVIDSTLRAMDNLPQKPLPNKNFIARLPINSQFIGLTRSIATSIVLAERNTKK